MSHHPAVTDHLQYQNPAVRHLAWMCHVPQLISSPMRFDPEKHLPENVNDRLREWEQAPANGPDVLTEQPARRLGHYFEHLYECLMRDLLGWDILLKNQPVRHHGITLGELDFIVRNPTDGTVEHHEIAIKFYLGYNGVYGEESPLWYGPNAQDRLDIKTKRLTDHQSQLTKRPETRALLKSLGIEPAITPRIFMPGYLFYPQDKPFQPPADSPPNHLRGGWLCIDELDAMGAGESALTNQAERWIPLIKPHWLGRWRQKETPDRLATEEALEFVRSAGIPQLFAVLEPSPDGQFWYETSRMFVVPRIWPGPPGGGKPMLP